LGYNAYKLGKTTDILNRESVYITSEVKRGCYKMVIKVDSNILDNLEIQLQIYFKSLNLHVLYK